MPTQDNCEDLQVESCVDENGQTIQGGDSYSVPTGRYVKHVVNVCGTGGSGSGSGMKVCAEGGLEIIGSDDDACMQIKTETDGALVLDGGFLKIDSTKLKVTTDNVYPAGTDPGLLSTLPAFTGPEGEVWNTQQDYNQWLYHDQVRQDDEIQEVKDEYLPLAGGNMEGSVQFNPEPFNGLTVFGSDGKDYNNVSKVIFKAENGGTYSDPQVIVGVEPTAVNHATTKKYVDDKLADLRDDIAATACPTVTSVATKFTDPNVTEDQIAIQYYGDDAPGHIKFSDVKVAGDNLPDINKKWLNINGVRYEATGTQLLPYGEIAWALDPSYGDMEHLVGTEVTVDNCDTYVLTGGDTMTGDLIVNATVHADVVETLVVDSGENSNLLLKHDGNTKVYVGSSQVTIQNPLKLNTEGTDDEHAVTKKYIDDKADLFAVDQQRQDDELAAEIQARVERDALHDAEIDTIEYKLEALVGLTFRGTYEFKHEADCDAAYEVCVADCWAIDPDDVDCRSNCANNLKLCEQDKVRPGFFEAVDPDDQFDHLTEIIISKADKSNLEIDWAGVLDKDDYLEVDHVMQGQLDKTNYGLYRIMEEPELNTNTYGEEVYTMKLQFLQGDGVMLENELYEIRGITAAEGVNPEELADFLTKADAAATYLPLIGGTLTGDLYIDKGAGTNTEAALTLTGSRTNINSSAATIAFENSQSPIFGYLTYRSLDSDSFFKFNHDVDLNNKALRQVSEIRMTPGGYIGSGENQRLIFNNASDGKDGDGLLVVPRPTVPRRGFVIRGNTDTNTEQDLLFTYTNASGADAVNYVGKMDSKTNLVNKEYVDSVAGTFSLNCGGGARWKKGGLNDSTGTYKYFGIEVAESSSSSAVGSGNVLYLNKLLDSEGVLQDMKNYTPTDNSYVEVYSGNELYFKGQLKPSTYKVASRNPDEIVCDMSSKFPIVANSGSSWSTSTTYKIIVTGLKRNG